MDDLLSWVFAIGGYIYVSVCLYVMAKKKGEDNLWFAFVPLLDLILLLAIADLPIWWIVLLLIPLVNIIVIVLVWMAVARSMGKPSWLGILIVIPLVNFGIIGYLAFSN